ncbi:Lrp/AsnC family transcriptional regulator [Asticcacaulis sp. AC402]|uniref:Lrp/AsnC family transcriptional regulator n=1 Tax=Asticcacaulis sp. AC402 TaxID=1282361 RepID=UPI0003C3E8E4|nr:Lrp/AsnC family transcriptional regulator [Asticcacaulis sp. AC402]ESQ76116.1 hypothetical protein ABAC402_06615 [Asticcacaulis sp. AC402]
MDDFDRKLLGIMQSDCTLSHAEMGRQVSLSASAVRRRLAALRTSGVIAAEVAVLGSAAQTGITVITSVAFERETPAVYDDFRARMRGDANVLQCYSVAGQADFILVVAAFSLEAYEAWGERVLLADPAIRRYDSYVAWSTTKFTTRRPVFE